MYKWEQKYNDFKKTGVIEIPSQEERNKRIAEINKKLSDINSQIKLAKPAEQAKMNEAKKRLLKERYKLEEKTKDSEKEEKEEKAKIEECYRKIGKVVEFRDKLVHEKDEIDEEIKRRGNIEKQSHEVKKYKDIIDNKSKFITSKIKEIKEIDRQLANSGLKEDEKKKLLAKKKDLEKQKDDATTEYTKAQDDGAKAQEAYDKLNSASSKYSNVSIEDLNNKKSEIANKISKCNFVCNNFSKGKEIEDFELSLRNWDNKTYSGKKQEKTKGKDEEKGKGTEGKAVNPEKKEKLEEKAIVKNVLDARNTIERLEKELKSKEALVPVQSEWAKKHPRLKAFFNMFTKNGRKENKILKTTNKECEILRNDLENEKKILAKYEEKQDEIEKAQYNKSKNSNEKENIDFIEEIRKITRTPEEIKQDKEEAYRKAKEKAYQREAKKFGKDYAKKSYDPSEKSGDER